METPRTGPLIAVLIVVALATWLVADVFLLVFSGVLFAIFLHGLSDWLGSYIRFSRGRSLAVVILALLGLVGAGVWRLAPEVALQGDQLSQSLPQAVEQLGNPIGRVEWMHRLFAPGHEGGRPARDPERHTDVGYGPFLVDARRHCRQDHHPVHWDPPRRRAGPIRRGSHPSGTGA